ncbi:MAG TPA: SMP-30/gluconolactonase/LRE family protein, partial [Verrucomicrobiae bacterium]|nr:SMP-30/gluconolactonase/LRE family protein [Verrucomicrobiae bacterium]
MKSLPVIVSGFLALGFAAHAADAGLLADGAKVEVLSEGYSFTEGPGVDRDGNVFFTDQPNDLIVKYNAADGSFS